MTDSRDSLLSRAGLLAFLLLICWAVWGLDTIFGLGLSNWGILPRALGGIPGIFFAPFLHGNLGHILANSVTFLILGGLVVLGGSRLFLDVSVFILLVSGVGIWLLGRNSVEINGQAVALHHVGASGVIFGYFGFLLGRGWYERKFASILLALFVSFFFGGMIWGVLPKDPGISWEAHLAGFIAGILAAKFLFERKRRRAS